MSQKKRHIKRRGRLTAKNADKYQLYQWAVQSPEDDLDFAVEVYKSARGKLPRHLREDFCGTALFAASWVKCGPRNTAEGFDTDPEPVNWGVARNIATLGAAQRRVTLHLADVREPSARPPDLRCAQNFSWLTFKTRAELVAYFSGALEDLAKDGVFLLDLFGGPQSTESVSEETSIDQGFVYVWDQREFWPVTGEYRADIHFEFDDGSAMENAFSYDWRLWTLPETIEILHEVGFADVKVFWETLAGDGVHGSGEYHPSERGENWLSWVAYIAAYK